MRTFFLFLALCLCFGIPSVFAQSRWDNPNFVIILADDLGFADLGTTGSKQIKTPHIDQLAQTGVLFTEGYVTSAVCAPSRAGLLTGRNQVEFGFDNNLGDNLPGFDPHYMGLPLSETTIATRLKKLGYATGLIGKWHLGGEEHFHPTRRGFDDFWGYAGGGHDYFKEEANTQNSYLLPIQCNYKTPAPISYITDDKGDECTDFIARRKDEPFFLFASFNAPHAPMQALEKDIKRYSHIKEKKRRIYAAMVHRLDVNVGKIMKALQTHGVADNTLVVFLSDNGGPADHNASCNAPYNGQKGILLEGGIHVPFIMNWPQGLKAGTQYDQPVTSLDIAATFYGLAGGKVTSREFSGVNLLPYITGDKTDAPHDRLKWKFTISRAIREGDWKLVSVPDRLPMLYNLRDDVSEQHNMLLENQEKAKELLEKLGKWDVLLPHPLFLEGSKWKARQLELYDRNYVLEQPE